MKKLEYILVGSAVLSLCLCGCSGEDEPEIIDEYQTEASFVPNKDYTLLDLRLELASEQVECISSINDFSLNLFSAINQKSGHSDNIVCSPVSQTISLIMMAAAGDEAFQQGVTETFKVDDFEELNNIAGQVNASLCNKWNGAFLTSANSVWMSDRFTPAEEYIEMASRLYDAPVNVLDLYSVATMNRINAWASDKTNGKIPYILSCPVKSDMAAMWINALYFEGTWQDKFDKDKTTRQIFHGTEGDTEVNMMRQVYAENRAGEFDGFKVASIMFGKFADFVIILPPEGMDMNEAAAAITPAFWKKMYASWNNYKLTLSLPRFEFDNEIDMGGAMELVGVSTRGRMPGIGCDEPGDAYFVQNASIHLDEDGATVAAVSHNGWYTSNGEEYKPKEMEIKLDRPFFFFFYSDIADLIIFAGRVCNL